MLARLLALALLACGAAALRPAIPARPASAVRSRAAAVCMADPPPKGKGYKTVYDDESPPPPRKDPLSNNMRDRLLREQQGLGARRGRGRAGLTERLHPAGQPSMRLAYSARPPAAAQGIMWQMMAVAPSGRIISQRAALLSRRCPSDVASVPQPFAQVARECRAASFLNPRIHPSPPPPPPGAGSDPNSKNPFLAVFGFVGVFVLLGALAVNFGPPAGGPFGP
jgi:hypothetical protein